MKIISNDALYTILKDKKFYFPIKTDFDTVVKNL